MKLTVMIGGEAGAGINTAEMYIERVVNHNKLFFLSYRNFMSRVRGGYNFTTITLSDSEVNSVEAKADVFLAINRQAFMHAKNMIKEGGKIVVLDNILANDPQDDAIITINEKALMDEVKSKQSKNIAAVGVAAKLLGLKGENVKAFGKWSDAINETNAKAFDFGYKQVEAQFEPKSSGRDFDPVLVNGNQAVALGALASGLGFYSAYPMSPSTTVMTYLSKHQKEMGIVVEQVEDEIAGMMAAIGASSNGVRAMTGTSGGGFALMVESLGFAAVSETPLVAVNVQRPGPATGLPTRTEQADLQFVVTASQGEFARIVLAPRSVEDCFYTTFRAFNLADKYNVPVIILSDQLLGDAEASVKPFDLDALEINRYEEEKIVEDYKKYDYDRTYGGRKYPGIDSETLIMTDSHVHDEYGHPTEDGEATVKLKKKLLKKLELIKEDLNEPLFHGDENYDSLFICWGSTYGAMKDAVDALLEEGKSVAMLSFTDVYPINETIIEKYLPKAKKVINVEGNAQNQFAKLLRMETGYSWDASINKYDGRPFDKTYLLNEIEVILND